MVSLWKAPSSPLPGFYPFPLLSYMDQQKHSFFVFVLVLVFLLRTLMLVCMVV